MNASPSWADAGITVTAVTSRRERREFVRLPFRLYRDDPCWVPPLVSSQMAFLDPRNNPFFDHAEVTLWLARRRGRVVGRISSHVDRLANRVHDERISLFGFFEAEDEEVATALLARAAAWGRERGAERLRGPLSFTTNHESGLLVDGDGEPPLVMMPHNPPSYPGFLERFGLAKAQDLLSFRLRRSEVEGDPERLPARLIAVAARLARRSRVTVRHGDMRRYDEELRQGFAIFNRAWERNWGFVPATTAELDWFARELKPIVVPRLSPVAEVDGEMVGFALTVLDANQILARLDGRLLPFGWIAALRSRRRVTRTRLLLFGVLEEHRQQGVEVLLFLELLREGLATEYDSLDLAWILESNQDALAPIMSVGAEWGLRPNRRYRVYEMSLITG